MEMIGVFVSKIILWILAIIAILILSAWGLVSWWRRQAHAAIISISERIQDISSQMDRLAGFLHAYKNIDQEPFFTLLEKLQSEAAGLEDRVQGFLDRCRAFEEEINTPPANRFQGILNAPVAWFHRWRQSVVLRRELTEIDQQIASSEKSMETIYELPWELATECRQASKEVSELLQTVQWLQANGAQGGNFQKVASQVPILQQSLNSISPIFLQAQKEDLLANANIAASIHVFEILFSLRPALNRYLPQVREWRADLEKASAAYTGLKQISADLRQSLSGTPAGLLVAPLQERLDHVAQAASELNQNLAQPDVDTLKGLVRESGQLHKVLQDTEQQFTRAAQQVAGLRRDLDELKDGLEKLSAQVSALEHHPKYPLAWDESGGTLNDLRQKLQSLGPSQQLRTPEQVVLQSAQVEALRASFTALAQKVSQAVAQHDGLLALLDQSDIRDGETWIKKSREMLTQAGEYDPKNWPKKDAPQDMLNELAGLEQLQKKLSPSSPSLPVQETSLPNRLEETRQLAAWYKDLHPRVDNLRERLEKLHVLEEQSKDYLTAAWSALEKVALMAESNQLLDNIISPEIDQLGEEIRLLGNELNNHGQGEIEKKAQRIQLQAEKNSQALSQWLTRLNAAVAEQARYLSERLQQIDAVARLDEPAVEDARNLLQRDEMRYLHSAQPETIPLTPQSMVSRVATRIGRAESRLPIDNLQILGELKRKNDFWQMLVASQRALEEKSAPLLAASQELTQARDEAVSRLGEVAKNFLNQRSWPPNNQALLPESQSLRPIDEKWEAMKKKSSRADWAILEMGRLAQQYRLLSERAGQVLNRIQQDHERIQELEWQIDALKQRWLSQSDPANSILREGVQQLLSQTDTKLDYIKQQYLHGMLPYEQAIQNLQLLYDDLYAAQVAAGANIKIGLNDSRHGAE